MREVLGLRFGRMHLLDVAILAALAVCVWRRWVWAGYALVLYQLANIYMWVTRATTPEAVETAIAGLGFAVVYGAGAYHLPLFTRICTALCRDAGGAENSGEHRLRT